MEQVRQSLEERLIQPDLLAWREGLEDWLPVEGLVSQSVGVVSPISASERTSASTRLTSTHRLFAFAQSVFSTHKRWIMGGLILVVCLIVFLVATSNTTQKGTYRTADDTASLTVLSGSKMDMTTAQGAVTGNYTREGDDVRLVVDDQVFHFRVVTEGLQSEDGVLYLSPSYLEAVQLTNEGAKKFAAKDFDGAITAFNQAIDSYSGYADAYAKRGDAECKKENYKAAEADYATAAALDPKSAAVESLAYLKIEESRGFFDR